MSGCMGVGKDVQILLLTYNGEKYLREQLDSYAAMEGFERVKVLVRDDGSTDGTKGILEEYREKYGFEVIYGENLGVNGSIKVLFENCDMSCEYFAISDQDDVWLPYKMTIALRHLEALPKNKPGIFASRSKIVSKTLKTLGETAQVKRGPSFYNAMVQNILPGHTQTFNRALMEILQKSDLTNALVIDWWIYMLAAAAGNVVISDKATVLHRQHGKNAVGFEANLAKQYWLRAKRLLAGNSSKLTRQLRMFYDQYKPLVAPEYEREILRFINCQANLISRLRYVFTCRIHRQTFFETFAMKVLYVMGNYHE